MGNIKVETTVDDYDICSHCKKTFNHADKVVFEFGNMPVHAKCHKKAQAKDPFIGTYD